MKQNNKSIVSFRRWLHAGYLKKGAVTAGILAAAYFIGTGGAHLSNYVSQGGWMPVSAEVSANWGLSFPTEGEKPVGTASYEEMKSYHAGYIDNTDEKIIYLTFDCGYENGNTTGILDTLKRHDVPATFFVVGNFLEDNPDLVRRMHDDGHIVGNHTYHHPDMSQILEKATFQKELADAADLYEEITGESMVHFYRPPQGKYSTHNLKMAKEFGYTTFFWSLAYVDWYEEKQPSKEEAIDLLTRRIHPGAVVLLHNTSSTNNAVLDELLTKWKEMGYQFESLKKLAAKLNES